MVGLLRAAAADLLIRRNRTMDRGGDFCEGSRNVPQSKKGRGSEKGTQLISGNELRPPFPTGKAEGDRLATPFAKLHGLVAATLTAVATTTLARD
jgi:hypothetical protein